jgi:hypothetical protein
MASSQPQAACERVELQPLQGLAHWQRLRRICSGCGDAAQVLAQLQVAPVAVG